MSIKSKNPNKFADNFFGQFKSPFELLVFYDQDFREERYKLYPWQIEILQTFSGEVPIDNILRMAVVAANGSGKSQYILAPCAAWMAVAFEKSLSYVTSASAAQLDTQTERFLDSLAHKMNLFHRKEQGLNEDIWKIVKRQKVFNPNQSYIDLFATDEPKKAEGKHPLYPGGEFAIFVDEGKGIAEDIYGAIQRCTGATRRLDISSAGACAGHFYEICTKAELNWWVRKVIWSDCPHVKRNEFDHAVKQFGINDPLVRSTYFSEFSSADTTTIIVREIWDRCTKLVDMDFVNRAIKFSDRRMGVDLSGGGDETVCSIWEGNIQLAIEGFRFYDTAQGAKEVINVQQKWGISDNNVWIEYDGFNRGVVDNIVDQGHLYNKVLAGSKALDKNRYQNRMTELWFNFKRYIEEGYIVFVKDDLIQKDQFCNRYYKRNRLTSKIQLESKQEARLNGHPSPDRADAAVIAWAGMPTIDQFLESNINKGVAKVESRYGRRVDMRNLEEVVEGWTYGEVDFFEESPGVKGKDKTVNSISCLPRNNPYDGGQFDIYNN